MAVCVQDIFLKDYLYHDYVFAHVFTRNEFKFPYKVIKNGMDLYIVGCNCSALNGNYCLFY